MAPIAARGALLAAEADLQLGRLASPSCALPFMPES